MRDRRPLEMWCFATGVSLFLILLIIEAPLLAAGAHAGVATGLYQAFAHVCHQLPDRSFFLAGHKLAVCARCTGIYAGFAVAMLFYPLLMPLRRTETPERKWLFVAAAPLFLDFIVGVLGIWENTHLSRVLTGALLGGVAVFYVLPGLIALRLALPNSRKGQEGLDRLDRPQMASAEVGPSDYSAPHRRI